jgi:hypothetical protein
MGEKISVDDSLVEVCNDMSFLIERFAVTVENLLRFVSEKSDNSNYHKFRLLTF